MVLVGFTVEYSMVLLHGIKRAVIIKNKIKNIEWIFKRKIETYLHLFVFQDWPRTT